MARIMDDLPKLATIFWLNIGHCSFIGLFLYLSDLQGRQWKKDPAAYAYITPSGPLFAIKAGSPAKSLP